MDLNKLKTFYHVALEGSYQKASIPLGIKPSYISKHITSLESTLNYKLFKRSHRSLILTDKGEEFLKSVQIIMNQIDKIEESSNVNKEESDIIRILTTTGVTNLWLVRKLKNFIDINPHYKVRIITLDEKVDVATHFADIAILPKIDPNPNLILKKLFTVHSRLFASKKYLEIFGRPKTPADLDNHRLISFYHNEAGHRGDVDWHLRIGAKDNRPRVPFLVINSAIGQFEAVNQGFGILAISEEFPYIDNTDLEMVLPLEGTEITVYFATHIDKMRLSKVLALEKFFMETKETKENKEAKEIKEMIFSE